MAKEFTLAQQQIIQDMKDYGVEQELIDIVSNPSLTPEQMHTLMLSSFPNYPADIGDSDYSPEEAKAELTERLEKVHNQVEAFVSEARNDEKSSQLQLTDEKIEELVNLGQGERVLLFSEIAQYMSDSPITPAQIEKLNEALEQHNIEVLDDSQKTGGYIHYRESDEIVEFDNSEALIKELKEVFEYRGINAVSTKAYDEHTKYLIQKEFSNEMGAYFPPEGQWELAKTEPNLKDMLEEIFNYEYEKVVQEGYNDYVLKTDNPFTTYFPQEDLEVVTTFEEVNPDILRQQLKDRLEQVRAQREKSQGMQKKTYSSEEKTAYKADRQAQVSELTGQMEQGIKDIVESGQYKEYLDMQRKFHNYSFRNVMLIMLQKPEATRVAGFTTWKKDFERFVQKGEQGIRIFAPITYKKTVETNAVNKETGLLVRDPKGNPIKQNEEKTVVGYKVVSVFDVSQTKGKELPEPVASKMLDGGYQDFDKMMSSLRSASPVPIRFESLTDGSNGYYDLAKKEIVICSGMSEAQTVKTVIHEIAHARLHDYDLKNPQEGQNRTDRITAEVQAESIAYVVSGYYGIDTSEYSFPYAATWGSVDMGEMKRSLHLISNTSGQMIERIDAGIERERTNERTQEKVASMEKSSTVREEPKNEMTLER